MDAANADGDLGRNMARAAQRLAVGSASVGARNHGTKPWDKLMISLGKMGIELDLTLV